MKYMTKEWYTKCQAVGNTFPCDEEQVKNIVLAYNDEYKNNFPTPPKFMDSVKQLHDCALVSAEFVENDFVITMDNNQSGINACTKIVLKNAVLKKKDFEKQELGWCYEELYPNNSGYELHVLLFEYGSDKMYDLIAQCKNIEIA